MGSNAEKLVILARRHPCLDIVPMVYSDAVQGDDWAWWLCSFGDVSVQEFACSEDRVYIKSRDFEDAVQDILNGFDEDDKKYKGKDDNELYKMAETEAKSLKWKKAIIVFVESL